MSYYLSINTQFMEFEFHNHYLNKFLAIKGYIQLVVNFHTSLILLVNNLKFYSIFHLSLKILNQMLLENYRTSLKHDLYLNDKYCNLCLHKQ